MFIEYPEDTFDKDKLMRCEKDRILLTPSMIHKGICAGHRIFIAQHITWWEWLKWKLGWLR